MSIVKPSALRDFGSGLEIVAVLCRFEIISDFLYTYQKELIAENFLADIEVGSLWQLLERLV